MKKIKIGFAGVGFMGQKAHLANYIDLDDCEVTALAEPRIEMGKKAAAHYGIREVYNSHTELLKNAEVDAIVASQRYGNHINLIPNILNAGIPVFTEKPIAISPENGKILADLADAKKVLYMVGYHKRSDPAMEYAIKVIRE